ncbi:unnamed protein product [Phytophthora lilii]|uniref:Unnamed protein product n=1 Tax=Phytophthora lilii TaxID=2077276 RepID=A0A9W6XT59_9STRA|nr:unnamed protein product [Phytophthora lilii]
MIHQNLMFMDGLPKAIRWFGRGRTEISVDEDAFAPEDIESFVAIAKETAKPQPERKLTEAQRLKLKLIKIVGDKYRRATEFIIYQPQALLMQQMSQREFRFVKEDREFIYFLIGRWLTVLDDKFDFMLMIHGEGGSGKSVLANLVKFAFGQDQIGLLSNSMQEKFGLSEFATKQIACCDDMPHNIAKTLPRSDFLSMMTRGSIS